MEIPGGFSGINSPLFQSSPTQKEKDLAKRVLNGEKFYPASSALWFYAPKEGEECIATWFNQRNVGRYKNHCFYAPDEDKCPNVY